MIKSNSASTWVFSERCRRVKTFQLGRMPQRRKHCRARADKSRDRVGMIERDMLADHSSRRRKG